MAINVYALYNKNENVDILNVYFLTERHFTFSSQELYIHSFNSQQPNFHVTHKDRETFYTWLSRNRHIYSLNSQAGKLPCNSQRQRDILHLALKKKTYYIFIHLIHSRQTFEVSHKARNSIFVSQQTGQFRCMALDKGLFSRVASDRYSCDSF